MIDADHHIGHCLFHQTEVAEREVAFVELAVPSKSLDHAVDVVPDTFRTAILEGPSRRLDGVGDHHDRRFLRPRPRPGVTEVFLPDLEALFQGLPVEETLDRRPLVLLDDLPDRGREVVLLEELNALCHVCVQDVGTGRRREVLVDIADVRLVLDEEVRPANLSNVVEVAADSRQDGVGAHRLGSSLGQVSGHDRMVVRAGGTHHQSLQEWVVGGHQFQQLHGRDDAGDLAEEGERAGRDQCRDEAADQGE